MLAQQVIEGIADPGLREKMEAILYGQRMLQLMTQDLKDLQTMRQETFEV